MTEHHYFKAVVVWLREMGMKKKRAKRLAYEIMHPDPGNTPFRREK